MEVIEGAIRWEGNNLESIRDFIADYHAVIEKSGTQCVIHVFEGRTRVLEITLEDGDGLMRRGGQLGVAREMRRTGETDMEDDETVH